MSTKPLNIFTLGAWSPMKDIATRQHNPIYIPGIFASPKVKV